MNQPTQHESQMHLDAMLYVLEDPSLDREAFEASLLDDARLGEILAEAVELFHSMRRSDADSLAPIYLDASSVRTYSESPAKLGGSVAMPSSWLGLATLAASFLVVGFFGWKSFQAILPSGNKANDEIAATSRNLPRTISTPDSLKKVVWAWGEVGTGHHEQLLTQYVSLPDNEVALASCDSVCDSDVPEWLVLATRAILELDGGVDLPLENIDSRTLIQ